MLITLNVIQLQKAPLCLTRLLIDELWLGSQKIRTRSQRSRHLRLETTKASHKTRLLISCEAGIPSGFRTNGALSTKECVYNDSNVKKPCYF